MTRRGGIHWRVLATGVWPARRQLRVTLV